MEVIELISWRAGATLTSTEKIAVAADDLQTAKRATSQLPTRSEVSVNRLRVDGTELEVLRLLEAMAAGCQCSPPASAERHR